MAIEEQLHEQVVLLRAALDRAEELFDSAVADPEGCAETSQGNHLDMMLVLAAHLDGAGACFRQAYVAAQRENGATWVRIARLMGLDSRQGIFHRYKRASDRWRAGDVETGLGSVLAMASPMQPHVTGAAGVVDAAGPGS